MKQLNSFQQQFPLFQIQSYQLVREGILYQLRLDFRNYFPFIGTFPFPNLFHRYDANLHFPGTVPAWVGICARVSLGTTYVQADRLI